MFANLGVKLLDVMNTFLNKIKESFFNGSARTEVKVLNLQTKLSEFMK